MKNFVTKLNNLRGSYLKFGDILRNIERVRKAALRERENKCNVKYTKSHRKLRPLNMYKVVSSTGQPKI